MKLSSDVVSCAETALRQGYVAMRCADDALLFCASVPTEKGDAVEVFEVGTAEELTSLEKLYVALRGHKMKRWVDWGGTEEAI